MAGQGVNLDRVQRFLDNLRNSEDEGVPFAFEVPSAADLVDQVLGEDSEQGPDSRRRLVRAMSARLSATGSGGGRAAALLVEGLAGQLAGVAETGELRSPTGGGFSSDERAALVILTATAQGLQLLQVLDRLLDLANANVELVSAMDAAPDQTPRTLTRDPGVGEARKAVGEAAKALLQSASMIGLFPASEQTIAERRLAVGATNRPEPKSVPVKAEGQETEVAVDLQEPDGQVVEAKGEPAPVTGGADDSRTPENEELQGQEPAPDAGKTGQADDLRTPQNEETGAPAPAAGGGDAATTPVSSDKAPEGKGSAVASGELAPGQLNPGDTDRDPTPTVPTGTAPLTQGADTVAPESGKGDKNAAKIGADAKADAGKPAADGPGLDTAKEKSTGKSTEKK